MKVRYLHSDIKTLERMEILRELRKGAFDVLDRHQPAARGPRHPGGVAWWPSSTPTRRASCARLARSSRPSAAPRATSKGTRDPLRRQVSRTPCASTLEETDRRRERQVAYNQDHGITPKTVQKKLHSLRDSIWEQDYVTVPKAEERAEPEIPVHEIPVVLDALRQEMQAAADEMEFERAAELRDRIRALEEERLRSQ